MTTKSVDLPHDLLAERSLIGCLLVDGQSYDDISDLDLVRDDFYHPKFGIIYICIQDLANSNRPIDYVTVCSRLTEMGQLDSVGGQEFVSEIIEDQASSTNVYHYAKTVKDKSALRDIIRTAQRVAAKGIEHSGSIDDFAREVEQSFFEITNVAKSGGMSKLNSCLKTNLKELEDNSRSAGELSGLSTGYPMLDRYLLGMQSGQLIVLAARPGMGKTSLALNIATKTCKQSELPVAIFSLEMLDSELSMRILSSEAKVDSKRLRTKNFLDTDLRSIGSAIQELSNLPIYINDNGNTTAPDILSQCRKIKSEQGLGLIIIDYLQLMRSHTGNPSREQQIAEISRGLKSMAKELQCPVIALSQLNRSVESRPDKRPNTADLRESGSIEQDADIVMMVYRDDFYNKDSKEPGIAEIIVAKNRAGETGTAKLAWVGAHTSFENLTTRPEGDD